MSELEPGVRVSWRDHAWTAAVLVVAAGTISAVADAGLFVGAVLLLAGFWLVAGAWRRTVWGCPFSHAADAEDPCPRHDLPVDA